MVHAREIDAKIIQDFIGDVNTGTLANYPLLKKENTNVSGNAFCEIGVAFSRNLIETEHHKFNIGANVKYVMGASNSRIGFNNFSGELRLDHNDDDLILTTKGSREFITEYGGLNNFDDDFSIKDALKINTSTIGFDIGAVYEFRKKWLQKNLYDAKIGFSITDIGSLNYKANANSFKYTLNTGNQEIRIDLQNIKNTLQSYNKIVTYENIEGRTFTSSLPTTMHLRVDVRICSKLFIDLT